MAPLDRSPLNGAVDIGLRALANLSAIYPRHADVATLVLFDYMLVHSGDVVEGPPSLHPPSPLRAGEIAVRRTLLEDGLAMYRSRGLIHVLFEPSGIEYRADESAAAFLDALTSGYVRTLRNRSDWLASIVGDSSFDQVQATITNSIDRWREEFTTLGATDLEALRSAS